MIGADFGGIRNLLHRELQGFTGGMKLFTNLRHGHICQHFHAI
jgi:hypothetical protein